MLLIDRILAGVIRLKGLFEILNLQKVIKTIVRSKKTRFHRNPFVSKRFQDFILPSNQFPTPVHPLLFLPAFESKFPKNDLCHGAALQGLSRLGGSFPQKRTGTFVRKAAKARWKRKPK